MPTYVSIPNRELMKFQLGTIRSDYPDAIAVSIPNRELMKFQQIFIYLSLKFIACFNP